MQCIPPNVDRSYFPTHGQPRTHRVIHDMNCLYSALGKVKYISIDRISPPIPELPCNSWSELRLLASGEGQIELGQDL